MRIPELNAAQVAKLSDMSADIGQVFLASIVLPSFGFGASSSIQGICIGTSVMIAAFLFALFFLRKYNDHYES